MMPICFLDIFKTPVPAWQVLLISFVSVWLVSALLGRRLERRHFLRAILVTVATAITILVLSACANGDGDKPKNDTTQSEEKIEEDAPDGNNPSDDPGTTPPPTVSVSLSLSFKRVHNDGEETYVADINFNEGKKTSEIRANSQDDFEKKIEAELNKLCGEDEYFGSVDLNNVEGDGLENFWKETIGKINTGRGAPFPNFNEHKQEN